MLIAINFEVKSFEVEIIRLITSSKLIIYINNNKWD